MTPSDASFEPTRWTLVMEAKGAEPEARKALANLCDRYYEPVFAFLCREEKDDDEAREKTHAFFERVLAGDFLKHVDPGRGRFRSFLLGALKHFLANRRAAEGTAKRGGDVAHVPYEESGDTRAGPVNLPASTSPASDQSFDRDWAFALIARALHQVEAEMAEGGKSEQFAVLKPWLDGTGASASEAAEELGMTENALRVTIHRLRQQLRRHIHAEVANTVEHESDVSNELHYLIEILATEGFGGGD